jgi:predicted Ser/Thr protein kinase
MQAERWKKIEELYQTALAQPPEKRAEFMKQACPGDAELRAEVELLLQAGEESSPLDGPPVSSVAERSSALRPGDKLGNFQIVLLLGRGGMGEVYRATDTKLGREVAIKVLPAAFAQDADSMARFTREARVLASLNHPNTGAIYGVEDRALVMELIEGRTLKGPLPIATALDYARQIAEALEAAHEKGIVHRDLKPANIMVTPAGLVKVLDFGLAKEARKPWAGDPAAPPTATQSSTRVGVIRGTAAYMSPEQARGDTVDKRSDIWTFGVVVYEMLTGKRAFSGQSLTDILAAVLRAEPDWSALPAATPPRIRKLLRRCLEHDRKQRLQAIGEARIAINAPEQDVRPLPVHRKRHWPYAAAALAIIAGAAVFWLTRPLPPPRITGTVQMTNDGRVNGARILTDGTRLFFNLAFDEARQVSLRGGESVPFSLPMQGGWLADISPDRTECLMYRPLLSARGEFYDTDEGIERHELWVAPLLGGSPRRLGDLIATSRHTLMNGNGFARPRRRGDIWDRHQSAAAWSPDGQQLVYAWATSCIWRVATGRGTASWPRSRAIRSSFAGRPMATFCVSPCPPSRIQHRPKLPSTMAKCVPCCRAGIRRGTPAAATGRRMESTSNSSQGRISGRFARRLASSNGPGSPSN